MRFICSFKGRQPARDASKKPNCMFPLLSAKPAVTFPASDTQSRESVDVGQTMESGHIATVLTARHWQNSCNATAA